MTRPKRLHKTVRLNLEISEAVRDRILKLMGLTESDTMTEVIRRALTVYSILLEYKDKNSTLIIKLPDNTEKELLIP